MRADRIHRLARRLDLAAGADDDLIRREHEIEVLRQAAALELHTLCRNLVRSLNDVLSQTSVELTPEIFTNETFQDSGPNIFQMSASGRLLQLAFESTERLIATENFKTPYILEGAVRWFNQELLEGIGVQEHLLFYCLGKRDRYWLHYDSLSHRNGRVDEDYLVERFEELL